MSEPAPSPDAADPKDPMAKHQEVTEAVLASGDADAIRNLYQDLGDDLWDSFRQGHLDGVPVLSAPETLPIVVGALDGTTGRILDAGCGPNPAAAIQLAMNDPGRHVVALDLGWGMVKTALEVARLEGVILSGIVGDLEHLPFRSSAFEGLVCDDTIEHVPDDRAGLRELARVLQPRGAAVLATPNRHSAAVLKRRLDHLRSGRRRPASDYFVANSHLREYTWPQFERLVRPTFVVERRIPVGWSAGPKRRLLTRLFRFPAAYRLSQTIVLRCHPVSTIQSFAPRAHMTVRLGCHDND